MRPSTLVLRSLAHYRRSNAAVVAGVAVAVAVLAGALLVGRSVRTSLRTLAEERIGRTDVALVGTRLFEASLAERLAAGFKGLTVNRVGSMLTAFFTDGPVTDWAGAARSDLKRFAAFHASMREQGFLLPPAQFEAMFTSAAHSERDVDAAVRAFQASGVA